MPGINLLPELSGDKSYHPQKWTQRHRMCVALSMGGFTNNEICEEMDWTPSKVSITLNDPRAEYERNNALAEIADVGKTVSEKLEAASHTAFDAAMEVLNESAKDDVKLKAAFGLMDRAGFTPIKREIRIEGEIPASPEVLEEMRKTLMESSSIKATYQINPGVPATDISSAEPEEIVEAEFTIVEANSESAATSPGNPRSYLDIPAPNDPSRDL